MASAAVATAVEGIVGRVLRDGGFLGDFKVTHIRLSRGVTTARVVTTYRLHRAVYSARIAGGRCTLTRRTAPERITR